MAMRRRSLGRTGMQVSELGYGAWGISGVEWIGADDERSLRSLHLAVERGVTFFDTALAYVQQQGNAAGMARALHIHPQTARYRINGLRKLLGDQLDDPGARFELEAALRERRV